MRYRSLAALQPHMGVPAGGAAAAAGGAEPMETEEPAQSGALSKAVIDNVERVAATYIRATQFGRSCARTLAANRVPWRGTLV